MPHLCARVTLLALVALAAAACQGSSAVDSTSSANVPGTTTPPVTPATATLAVGESIPLTATVDYGAQAPVWSSSDPNKVSVTQAGLATAIAKTPGVSVCAGSTAYPRAIGCATVTVQ
jgi:uncharacterized protein YjdB